MVNRGRPVRLAAAAVAMAKADPDYRPGDQVAVMVFAAGGQPAMAVDGWDGDTPAAMYAVCRQAMAVLAGQVPPVA